MGVMRRLAAQGCTGTGADAFVGGAGGNVAAAQYSFVGGGQTNLACDGWGAIAGGFNNTLDGTNTSQLDNFIGAGEYNVIDASGADSGIVTGNTNYILGGFENIIGGGQNNTINGTQSAIVDGTKNTISSVAEFAFLGAGSNNTVSGGYGAVVSGLQNSVSGEAGYVGAGGYNTASGVAATVGGGGYNTASGNYATVTGGTYNTASGNSSFAAGKYASAATNGSFVWSDGSNGSTALASSQAYQFIARASGGFTLWTNAAATVGATLAPGSGAWASASDRNMKTDVVPIDDAAVLEKVAALPIDRWSYISEHGVRHVGPMAQDFYAAFGIGEDNRHITSIDENGVALAAIKALEAKNRLQSLTMQHQSAQIAVLQRRSAQIGALQRQSAQIAAMQKQIEALTATVAKLRVH